MSAIINFSLNLDNLNKSKIVKGKKGTYYNLTLRVNDEVSQFGDNVSVYDAQTSEERTAKSARNYVGNGKVTWTDGNIQSVAKEVSAQGQKQDDLDFPF
jgi:hypothetical protein